MPGSRRFHAGVRQFRRIARLWRGVAVVLCCGAVLGLLAAMRVMPTAAQTIDCSSQSSAALIRDCETLLGLKGTLDPDDVLNWAGNVAMGSWNGVAIDNAFGVTGISLNNNGLGGSIPTALGNLSNLTQLDLVENQLSGSIPVELGNLSNLTDLGLGWNELSGSIPVQLGSLSNLLTLSLSCNQLSGDVPSSLAGILVLALLYLNGNSFNLPLHADLLNKDGLTIYDSTYCFATAPRNVRVQPGDRQLTVTWAAPADDGAPAGATGVAITAYNLRYWESGATDSIKVNNV